MKRLLLDVNIVLDVLLERPPHSEHAIALWALIEGGRAPGLLSAHAVTIVHISSPTNTTVVTLVMRSTGSCRCTPSRRSTTM